MSSLQTRHGQGKIGCAIWLLIAVVFFTVCWKIIPVKIKTAELYDFMEEQAQRATRSSDEAVKANVLARAKDLDLPVGPKDVTVQRRGGRVIITARYSIPIEFPGYTYVMEIDHVVDRPVFAV
jgi:hypothetical protein